MFRRLPDSFTATHFTILALGAMFVPGALYAAGTFTSVVIQDSAGHQATVIGGKLDVYDPISDPLTGYASNPANYVKAYVSCSSSGTSQTIYTVPSGKALILKSANFSYYSGTSGGDNYAYLYADGTFVAGIESGDVAADHSADFGNGASAKTAMTIACSGAGGAYLTSITGYLVPSTAVPQAPGAAARGGPQLVKNGKVV